MSYRTRPRPALAVLTALAVAATLAAADPARAADPFYEQRLREGREALERGAPAEAVRPLRLAAFGLLDEPERLAESLVYLAVAHAESGDAAAFEQTFRRVLEIERRFDAYRGADVPVSIRERLRAAAAALPPELLLGADAFRDLGAAALCRRGLAHAGAGAWAAAAADLERCEAARTEPAAAAALLTCLIELERWDDAAALLAALPPAVAGARAIVRQRRRVERHVAVAPPAAGETGEPEGEPAGDGGEAPDVTAATAPPPEGEGAEDGGEPSDVTAAAAPPRPPEDAAAAPPPELSAADRRQLEAGRAALASARAVGDVEPALAAVREVADRNPGSAEAQLLAAEIAYRARRFEEAAAYFERGGEPPAGRPDLLFYRAVALYESGRRAAAAEVLERALPSLRRTPFVEEYVGKILGARPE